MQLNELHSFKLSDAVTFHDELNPKLWAGQKLRPKVKKQLLLIAQDFIEELGIHDLDVKDITVSGSNAAYSYTKHSDLDLHILVDLGNLPQNEVYKELFQAKKSIYNDSHDITIHGVPVELYVQDAREPVVSLGEYSILNDKWLRIPTKRRANFDQTASKAKYDKLLDIIKRALKSSDIDKVNKVLKKIKQYRQAGLDKGGEFGPENLAFKALRSQGYIQKLYALRDKLHSEILTIETMYKKPEQNKLKDKLSKEFSKIADEDYDPNGPPPGPEFKPTMPAGTVKVDVSDVYDWYKLGQHISNLKGLGHHDFGQGPPSTIMSFGSEPEEHEYIQDLEKTGLTTTDIDPLDKNQPKGMKRQKVDPTYNVNEKINPEVVKKDFHAEKEIDIKDVGPLKLVAQNVTDEYPQQFRIDVITPDGKKIGYFRFVVHDYEPEPKYKIFSKFAKKKDPYVLAGNVSVWSEYQKKGIATEVYKWVKSMGNDIRPSGTQTPAGKAMWKGFEKNASIEEDDTLRFASEKTPPVNPYGGLKDNQFRGSIAEAFDQPYPIKWEKSEYGDYDAMTKLPDGTPLTIMFDHESPDDVVITFWRNNNLELTGEGDAQRVFATVLHAIQEFLKMEQPTNISFSASKEVEPGQNEMSRAKLYDRLVKRYAQQWGYNAQAIDRDEGVVFKLTRKQNVAEASGYIPSEKEKNDPRFKTALTVDVKPDSIKKNAKAFYSKVSRAGIPPTARPDGKF